jgi:hypothetical protein
MSSRKEDKIRRAIQNDDLKVKSVDPHTGSVDQKKVNDVMKHDIPESRTIVEVSLENGDSVVVTEDHSLFTLSLDRNKAIEAVEASDLRSGESLVYVDEESARPAQINSVDVIDGSEHDFYDLSVEDYQNFTLSNGILAHNSYSIGGISLDLSKSDKYESLQSTAQDQFQQMLEQKRDTVNITKGLKQSRYGVGVRSAFGPITGEGQLTPRKYLGF